MRFFSNTLLFASLFATLSGCASEGPPPHIVRVIADDGTMALPVAASAIEEVEVIIVPDPADGDFVRMDPMMLDDDGLVEARVTAAGEWVLKLSRAYLDANADTTNGFRIDVPLFTNQSHEDQVRDPTLRVNFVQGTERIGQSSPRFVPWPLVGGEVTTVVISCDPSFEAECQ